MSTPEDDPITCDAITRDFRIFQRRRGHRYSLDDVATAWEACGARPDATRYIDLGTGIGSVLLMVTWKLPAVRFAAIEAQEISFGLLARNVAAAGLTARGAIAHGDLRDPLPFAERADLITGTPPYLPPGTATAALDGQRAHARIELRGGVEAYCLAAASRLAPGGRFVLCADARTRPRTLTAAAAAGLAPIAARDVVPRAGKGALFTLHTLGLAAEHSAPETENPALVVRDEAGQTTDAGRAIRAFFGLG